MAEREVKKATGVCPAPQPPAGEAWDPAHLRKIQEHPCYSAEARHCYGRIHLPVAPNCNIQCKYCDRRFDCVNESRPGVTSQVLTPEEALEKVSEVIKKHPFITVVGIAGPGEPLANEETFTTLRLVKEKFPKLISCISTNGLYLAERLDELVSLEVGNITVTLNALEPEIGEKIYSFIRYHDKVYKGKEAAALLIKNQLKGIEAAVKKGAFVKVNCVLIPGVNDHHMADIARKVKELGAYMQNVMPLIPQYLMADIPAPTPQERKQVQDDCEPIIRQMRHCRQCRADAVGLLDHDISQSCCGSPDDSKE
ncbi:nitrogenase cofactor biosynthesis protein NifB [Chloroflexota bacterium]